MSGFAHITGPAGGPPTLPPFMLADGVASLNATYAVMMALYHRDVHGGPGQLIDVNLIDPLARLLEQTLLGYDQLGLVPERAGNRWDISAPRNTYQTADGRVAGHVRQLTGAGATGVSRDRSRRPADRPRLLRPAAATGPGP